MVCGRERVVWVMFHILLFDDKTDDVSFDPRSGSSPQTIPFSNAKLCRPTKQSVDTDSTRDGKRRPGEGMNVVESSSTQLETAKIALPDLPITSRVPNRVTEESSKQTHLPQQESAIETIRRELFCAVRRGDCSDSDNGISIVPSSLPLSLRNIIYTTLQGNKQGVEHRIILDATDYSASETIKERTLQLTGTPNTMLIPLSESEQSPLLTAQNSSLRIVSMTLSSCGKCLCLEDSSATLFGTRLVIGRSGSPIVAVSSCVELLSTTFILSPGRLFPSLVESVSTDCFVGLHNLALENGIVCGDEPLLGSKETSSVLSSNNKMWNMTHTTRSLPHTMTEAACKTCLISTTLECVDDPFYGSIVSHINTGGEFLFSNSSFKSLVGNDDAAITCPAEGCWDRQGNYATSSLTVLNCAFVGCKSKKSGATFGYSLASGLFNCQVNTFTDCESENSGGGFELQRHAQSYIARNRFTTCRAAVCGGGMVANYGYTSMTITDCSFVNCQGTSGSAIHRNAAGSSTTISGLIFDDCKALCGLNFNEIGSAGALFIDLSRTTQVSSCSVKHTLLGLDGGTISCNLTSGCSLSAYDLLIEGSIPQCPVWMKEELSISRMTGVLLSNLVNELSMPQLTVTTHGVFVGTDPITTGKELGCTVRLASSVFNTQAVYDEKWCGLVIPSTVSSPFQTVSGSTRVMWHYFALDCSAATEIALANVNGGSFVIESVEMTFSTDTFQQDLVSVADGELTVKNVSLGQLCLSGKSFFVLSGGSSGSMTDVTVVGMTQSGVVGNGVFARLSDSSALSVSSSAFTGVSSVGDGGVLFSTSSGCISLSSCSFSLCSCGVSSHGKIAHISTTSFTSDSFTFTDSSVLSSGSSGLSELFLSGADIASLAKSSILGSLLIEYEDVTESNVALVFGENGSTSGPLPYFVHPHICGNAVHVSTGFWDHSDCGLEKLPCASFAHGWSRVTVKDDVVTLLTSSAMNEKVESPSCGAEVSSKGPSGGKLTLTLDVSAQFSVNDGDLALSNIILLLPSSLVIPAFVVGGRTLTLSSATTIQNPSSASTHQSALLSLASGSILVDSTSFDFTSPFVSKDALISQKGGSHEMKGMIIENVTRTSGNGAIVNSVLSATDSLEITYCSFSSCHTQSGDGGVLWISCANQVSSASLVIDATFTTCSCDSAHKGKWVYLQGHSFGSLLTPTNWESTLASLTTPANDSLLMGEDLVESEGSSFRSLSLLFYLVDFKGSTITTGSDGRNAKGCGQSSLPCSSVGEAWLHLKDLPRILEISSSSQLNSELSLNEADVEMKPTSETGTVRIGKTGSFILSTHSLIATSLSFVPVVATETRDSSLFSVVGGSLTIALCSFTDFSLSSQPLIDHTGKTLKMDDVEFERIVRVNGDGSVLESEMISEMKLDLNNIRMIDVSSTNGKCDGLFVRFGSKSTPLATPQFNLSNLHFSTTPSHSLSASSNIEKDERCFLWIEGANLGSIIFEGDSRFEGSYSEDVLDGWMWTDDWTTNLSCSLLFYLREKKGPVGIDTLGNQSPHCGFFTVWCSTLSAAVARLASAESDVVEVQSSFELSDSVSFSNMKTFRGIDSDSTVTIQRACSFSVSESSSLVVSISSLRFLLPTSLDADQLFLVAGGTLHISSCSFSPETGTPFSFQLICGSGEKVIVESTNVSSASLSSAPLISSSCDVSISHSQFSSIVLSEGNGSVLQAEVSSTCHVSVLNTVFSDCSNSEGKSVILLTKGTGASFSSSDWEGTFDLSSNMNDVLVLDPSLPASQFNPYSLLYEFYPRKANEIVVRSSEWTMDHPLCGNASLACHSICVGRELTRVEKIVIVEKGGVWGRMEMNGESLTIVGKKGKERLLMVGEGQIVDNAHSNPDNLKIEQVIVDVSLSNLSSSSALFVLENGKIEISDTSIESPKSIGCQLISVLSGDVHIHQVSLSNLILTHPSPISIASSSNCSFSNIVLRSLTNTPIAESPSNEDSDTLCSWSSGFISLSNTTANFLVFSASNVSHGALFVSNSSVSIEGGIFHNNSAFSSAFPSANRNIRCVNSSSLTIDSLNGGDGSKDHRSAWMSVDDDCVLSGVDAQPDSPLFVPTLWNESKSTLKKKGELFEVRIVGSTLIPCGLFLEVFEMTKEKKEGKSTNVSLTLESVLSFTETEIVLNLLKSSLSSLSSSLEWRGRLKYGNLVVSSEWFVIQKSSSDRMAQSVLDNMKWWLPLALGIAVLILFFILLIVCLRVRRGKNATKSDDPKQELDVIEVKEDFDFDQNDTFGAASTRNPNLIRTNETYLDDNLGKARQTDILIPSKREEPAFCMSCTEPFDTYFIKHAKTLYSVLHEEKKPLSNARQSQIRIAKTLEHIGQSDSRAPILTALTTHWVLTGGDGSLWLRTSNPNGVQQSEKQTGAAPSIVQNDEPAPLGEDAPIIDQADIAQTDSPARPNLPPPHTLHSTHPTEKQTLDHMTRWMAPEQRKKGENEIDVEKVLVFRLGLVLYEIETGLVPFGETDAVNAHRQLETGIVPPLDRVVKSEMRDLIVACLSIDWKRRPSLSSLTSTLESIEENPLVENCDLFIS
ncbi:hypothetical protein BLNAU_17488 [Blattamonas nauphoetae]|uniref:Protein kinase domain-containing protein n=1 Tax=Blattamonas nauphoetae TaxID=2049346 RepID=A0ABQ9X7F6_9EUKA|nr:hypothetical protein BLNAU_17488 [Blattamonas nauphoetae]